MNVVVEPYASKEEIDELNRELGFILLKIHRKWQLYGQGEDLPAHASVPLEEMETVIIRTGSEAVRPVNPVAEELTETVILSPLAYGTETVATEGPVEEIPETVIMTSDAIRIASQGAVADRVEEETVILGGARVQPGQPQSNEEAGLDETVILPPRKERMKPRGNRS